MRDFTDDVEVLDDFEERLKVNEGSEKLPTRLIQHNSKSPGLSAEDLDADWEGADVSGEGAVAGV